MSATWHLAMRTALLTGAMIALGARLDATTYTVPGDPVPGSLLAGDVLNLNAGGVVPSSFGAPFVAQLGSVVNLQGGKIGDAFTTAGKVNLLSGMIGSGMVGLSGSEVKVYGGSVGSSYANRGGHFELYGGEIGYSHSTDSGGVTTVYDGTINTAVGLNGGQFYVHGGEVRGFEIVWDGAITMDGGTIFGISTLAGTCAINISGGRLTGPVGLYHSTDALSVIAGLVEGTVGVTYGHVSVSGTSFLLGGAPIPGLKPGETMSMDRAFMNGRLLTATLTDGSPFRGIFSTDPGNGRFDVTLVPEPTGATVVLALLSVTSLRRKKL